LSISFVNNSVERIQINEDFAIVSFSDYGLSYAVDSRDTSYDALTIEKIDVFFNQKKITIPNSLLKDLFNPNLFYKYNSILPISVYFSNETKSVYIYVFGDVSEQSVESIKVGYLCKIIVDINGKSGRIQMPGKYLEYYGGIYCNDFWWF
jgi:hypothetical protein